MPSSGGGGSSNHGYVFLAGSISGVVEGVTVQPLELLKTRFQLNQGPPMRLVPAVREILAEGGARQLYRGGLPEITGLIPRATAALSTLEFSRRLFSSWHGGQLLPAYAYLSGALSGVTEAVAFSPFQVIKVRLMAKEHLGRYHNTPDCLRKVLAGEGVAALFIGLAPTLWRNASWNGAYYGTMHVIEERLPHLDSSAAAAARQLGIGTLLGIACTVMAAPFDVVKSRFQSELLPALTVQQPGPHHHQQQQQPHKRRSVFGTLAQIARTEGRLGLYRGFVPKALRLGVGQSVGLLCFQRLLAAFGVEAPVDPSEPEHIPTTWE